MNVKSLIHGALTAYKGKPSENMVPTFPQGKEIPRIIHQVFPSKVLPQELQDNIEKIQALNPGWQYQLYDDQDMLDFIKEHYGAGLLEYYLQINPAYGAARTDLFRYLLIYKTGGVYIDIKSSITRPLDDVLRADDVFLLAHWQNKTGEEFEGWGLSAEIPPETQGEFQQWHVVAAPGHPFLRAVIKNVLTNISRYNPVLHGTGKYGVLRLTGPIAYTLAIQPALDKHKHRLINHPQELGFEYSIYRHQQGGTMNSHMAIFKIHYSMLVEPIIDLSLIDKLLVFILERVQAVRKMLKP